MPTKSLIAASAAAALLSLTIPAVALCSPVGLHVVHKATGHRVLVVGSVPEPATWAMMLVGAFGVGAAARMRRRTAIA